MNAAERAWLVLNEVTALLGTHAPDRWEVAPDVAEQLALDLKIVEFFGEYSIAQLHGLPLQQRAELPPGALVLRSSRKALPYISIIQDATMHPMCKCDPGPQPQVIDNLAIQKLIDDIFGGEKAGDDD